MGYTSSGELNMREDLVWRTHVELFYFSIDLRMNSKYFSGVHPSGLQSNESKSLLISRPSLKWARLAFTPL
jgi:hypothetical protein